MSRIEMAMEMAAGKRGEAATDQPGASATAGPASGAGSTPRALWQLPKDPLLVNLNDPFSAAAEQYRKLKASLIELSRGREEFRNMIMVTSAVPGEGRSITALNLAVTLARETDHQVLLVDADLRNPALHRYLGVERGAGLGDVLLGMARIGEVILPAPVGKLALLQAGREIANPSEVISSARMKGLLEELKHGDPDRYVIFDTPPLLRFAETRTLARAADGVLLVIMERLVSRNSVLEALDALKGCRVLGTVYNAAEADHQPERHRRNRGQGESFRSGGARSSASGAPGGTGDGAGRGQ